MSEAVYILIVSSFRKRNILLAMSMAMHGFRTYSKGPNCRRVPNKRMGCLIFEILINIEDLISV